MDSTNIAHFPNRPTPTHLDSLLRHGQWDQLASALQSGISPSLEVRGFPVFVAVLQALQFHEETQHLPDYHPATIPLSLRQALVDISWPEVLPEHDEKPKTVVSWACFYGHLDLALDLVARHHRVDTPQWTIWDAMVEGLLTRGPMIHKTVRTKGDDHVDIVILDKEALDKIKWFNLLPLVGAVKHQCSKWPGQNLGDEHNHVLSSLVIAGHTPLIDALLAHGASPDCALFFQDTDGPVRISTTRACEIAVEMEHDDILHSLMSAGARWGAQEPGQDHSLLDVCAMVGHMPSIDYVLRHCPVRQLCHDLPDAMLHAVAYGNLHVVKRLHDAGAPLYLKTPSGFTLMHQAAASGHMEILDWLHEQGLSWEDVSLNGVSPLDLLAQHHPQLAAGRHISSSNVVLFPRRP